MIYEARCQKCGEVFNPTPLEVGVELEQLRETGNDGLFTHLVREDGVECGGHGYIKAAYEESSDGRVGVFVLGDGRIEG